MEGFVGRSWKGFDPGLPLRYILKYIPLVVVVVYIHFFLFSIAFQLSILLEKKKMALLDFLFLQHPVLATVMGLVIALVVSSARARSLKDYPDLPWVGRKSNKFGATTYANWMSASHTREWLTEGYNKVCQFCWFFFVYLEKMS